MERFFNTAGPVKPERHYNLDPLKRFDVDEILSLIRQEKYFILHAPRQTGKTSTLLALADHLNKGGEFVSLYFNVEAAQTAREDVGRAMRTILNEMAICARDTLGIPFLREQMEGALQKGGGDGALGEILSLWSNQSEKPLVIMMDEVDALVGDTLVSVLRQLRSGYTRRPADFPQSVILCGLRDLRDYRIHSTKYKEIITGGSAFNVKAKSLRMDNFNQPEVEELLVQHTQETGQQIEPRACELIWELAQGQPWLTNALAYEVTFEMKAGRDRTKPITSEMVEEAKENLIVRRETHLDQITDKLVEERVRRVIEPILAGDMMEGGKLDYDKEYVADLGLIVTKPLIRIANPIYQEIVPRVLNTITQDNIPETYTTWLTDEGLLDWPVIWDKFLEFWRENGEPLIRSAPYHEVAPHLVLMAYLQRIANSGGTIIREYAIGRRRMDLLVKWFWKDGNGKRMTQLEAMELKVWHEGKKNPLEAGLVQLSKYLSGLSLDEGTLVIFDRRDGLAPLEERVTREFVEHEGRRVQVIRG